jgi:plastocyanin
MNSKLLLGLLVIVLGVVVGWYIIGMGKKVTPVQNTAGNAAPQTVTETSPSLSPDTTSTAAGDTKGGVQEHAVVTYTDKGFGPISQKVKAGTVMTFVNESTKSMWVASDPHPTHTLLPGFDQLAGVGKSGTYDYTFAKVGTWKYHNHMNPSDGGTVVVTP